jgi:prepilin-type processing-associated H-X9-DG protein
MSKRQTPAAPYHALYTYRNESYGHNYFGLGAYWNSTFVPITSVKDPSQTYFLGDNSDSPAWAGQYIYQNLTTWRHSTGLNVLWVDGHVSWMTTQTHYNHGFYSSHTDKWWDIN